METFLLDLRHAARRLRREPRRSVLAAGVIAVSVAVAVSTWSAVRCVLLQPLPYRQAERLALLTERHDEKGVRHREVAPARFVAWREQARSFAGLAAYQKWGEMTLSTTGSGDAGGERAAAEVVTVVPVTQNFLSLLGLEPALGRDFANEDLEGGGRRVALLGHRLWQRRFAGDAQVLGRSIRLQGVLYSVIGVLPASAVIAGILPLGAATAPGEEVLVPMSGVAWQARVYGALDVVGRLDAGVELDAARAELQTLASAQALEFPGTDEGWSAEIVPLREVVAGAFGPVLTLLLVAVLVVHLLACSNLAGLFLSAAIARSREAAVRAVLGASRARLQRLVLLETSIISLAGASIGLLLAIWGVRLMPALASISLPLGGARIDLTAAALTVAIAAVTGLLIGLPPALVGSRATLAETVRGAALASDGRGRSLLVITQMALAALLLLGATLTVRTLLDLRAIDPGFQPERVLTMRVDLPRWRYEGGAARRAALARLLERFETMAGVEAAGAVNQAPLGRISDNFRLWLPGSAELRPIDLPTAEIRTVAGGYLDALGVTLLRGRALQGTLADGGPGEALVNEPLAARLWPGRDPLGQRLSIDGAGGPWLEVVGVLAAVRHFGVEREVPPELYVPYRQVPWPSVAIALRGSDPGALLGPALTRLRELDPELAAYEIATLGERLDQTLAPRRLPAVVLTTFAAGGAVVAALGLYAALAFGVARREREIGLRMAVGARSADIARTFLTDGLRLVVAGLVAGLAGGWLAARLATRWIERLHPLDLGSVAFVALLCVGVGLAAGLGPSVRAARQDPANVLRR